jgi:hypothetical protein
LVNDMVHHVVRVVTDHPGHCRFGRRPRR